MVSNRDDLRRRVREALREGEVNLVWRVCASVRMCTFLN